MLHATMRHTLLSGFVVWWYNKMSNKLYATPAARIMSAWSGSVIVTWLPLITRYALPEGNGAQRQFVVARLRKALIVKYKAQKHRITWLSFQLHADYAGAHPPLRYSRQAVGSALELDEREPIASDLTPMRDRFRRNEPREGSACT